MFIGHHKHPACAFIISCMLPSFSDANNRERLNESTQQRLKEFNQDNGYYGYTLYRAIFILDTLRVVLYNSTYRYTDVHTHTHTRKGGLGGGVN